MKTNKIIQKYYPVTLLMIFILCLFFGIGKCFSYNLDPNFSIFKSIDNSNLKIVQFSDVHLDSRGGNNSKRLLKQSFDLFLDAINQVNNINNVDVVLFSGDVISRPNEDLFVKFINMANTLKVPWYSAMGNHDIGIFGGLSKSRYISLINQYNKNVKAQNSYYSFSPKKGYLVIVMDGIIIDRITSNGYFGSDQLSWLDNELEKNSNSKVVIVQHHPAVEPFKSKSHRVIDAVDYLKIIDKHKNVIAVLSGHYHGTKLIKRNNVVYVSTPSLVGYPNAFRVMTISDKDGKIQLQFDFKETNLKELQKKSLEMDNSKELSIGKPEDRNTTIILNK